MLIYVIYTEALLSSFPHEKCDTSVSLFTSHCLWVFLSSLQIGRHGLVGEDPLVALFVDGDALAAHAPGGRRDGCWIVQVKIRVRLRDGLRRLLGVGVHYVGSVGFGVQWDVVN